MVPSSSLIEGVAWYSGTSGLGFFAVGFSFDGGSLRFISTTFGRPRVAYCLLSIHCMCFAATRVFLKSRELTTLRKERNMQWRFS
jgi:hypothetical protein